MNYRWWIGTSSNGQQFGPLQNVVSKETLVFSNNFKMEVVFNTLFNTIVKKKILHFIF
jgi:hypothetical protein